MYFWSHLLHLNSLQIYTYPPNVMISLILSWKKKSRLVCIPKILSGVETTLEYDQYTRCHAIKENWFCPRS